MPRGATRAGIVRRHFQPVSIGPDAPAELVAAFKRAKGKTFVEEPNPYARQKARGRR